MQITAETRLLDSINIHLGEIAKTLKKYENLKEGRFTLEEFRDRRLYVVCPTSSDADTFLGYLHGKGFKYRGGASLLSKTHWEDYRENTAYSVTGNGVKASDARELTSFATCVWFNKEDL